MELYNKLSLLFDFKYDIYSKYKYAICISGIKFSKQWTYSASPCSFGSQESRYSKCASESWELRLIISSSSNSLIWSWLHSSKISELLFKLKSISSSYNVE